jgi:excisionase family DNA binding protein
MSSPNTSPGALAGSRNLGGAKQAAAIAGVTNSTVLSWARKGLIGSVRVGNGRYRYDLDDVAAMVVEYPRDDVDDRIAELVANAPEFSAAQVNKLRLLLHATPAS